MAKILLLTPDVSDYDGAFYQKDIIKHLKRKHGVYIYGSGKKAYSQTDELDDILDKCEFVPDVLCIGHMWLRDDSSKEVVRHELDFTASSLPTMMFLNKEYTNYDGKLRFISQNDINTVFTHANKTVAREVSAKTDTTCIYWPHGVDPDKFRDYGEPKEWDVSFSGILTNPYQPTLDDEPQTYIRKEIQREIFYTVGDLPLRKRPKYRDKELFWRAKPAGNITKWVNRLVHDVSPLPDEDYFRLLNRSRISLNTLSPVPTKMLSTRYFESFASNSLVLCPKSPLYDDLFTAGEHCVTFDRDLSEFTDKVEYYLEHDEERKQIAQRGHEHVLSNHTWEDRIETLPEHVDAL